MTAIAIADALRGHGVRVLEVSARGHMDTKLEAGASDGGWRHTEWVHYMRTGVLSWRRRMMHGEFRSGDEVIENGVHVRKDQEERSPSA